MVPHREGQWPRGIGWLKLAHPHLAQVRVGQDLAYRFNIPSSPGTSQNQTKTPTPTPTGLFRACSVYAWSVPSASIRTSSGAQEFRSG